MTKPIPGHREGLCLKTAPGTSATEVRVQAKGRFRTRCFHNEDLVWDVASMCWRAGKTKGDSRAAQRITRKEPWPRAGEQQKGLGPQDFIAQEGPGELRGRPLGRRPCSLLLVSGRGCNKAGLGVQRQQTQSGDGA